MTDFVNAVSTVGFPIACCIFLLWQSAKQDEQRQREMSAMRKVIDSLQKTVYENTSVLRELVTMLKGDIRNVQGTNEDSGKRQ